MLWLHREIRVGCVAAECCRVLQVAEERKLLQSAAECCRMLLSPTGCYRVLQGATGCYRVLQGATGCYSSRPNIARTTASRSTATFLITLGTLGDPLGTILGQCCDHCGPRRPQGGPSWPKLVLSRSQSGTSWTQVGPLGSNLVQTCPPPKGRKRSLSWD